MRAAGFAVEAFAPFDACPGEAARLRLNPLEILPVGIRPAARPNA
jgi:hypothetical protein